jgi:hypothetical protein
MHRSLGGALAVSLAACGGCGGGSTVDAPITVDIFNGSCGDQLLFTGEYVDWDNDTTFCGVFNATFAVPGGTTDTTAPNGRFGGRGNLCISRTGTTIVDITPAAAMSECTVPLSTYPLAGVAFADPTVILAGAFFSGRNITVAREGSLGVTLDPAKAHVFVHIDQGARTIALAAAHGAPQAIADKTWGAGDTGHEVFFPNVDLGGGTTALTVTGGAAIGAGDIPLVANKIVNVTVLAR